MESLSFGGSELLYTVLFGAVVDSECALVPVTSELLHTVPMLACTGYNMLRCYASSGTVYALQIALLYSQVLRNSHIF